MKATPWIEKDFYFGFPATDFPYILERLRGTVPRLLVKVEGVAESRLTAGREGKWTVKQHIGHLTDLETLHEGRLDDYKAGLSLLRAADMSNAATNQAGHNTVPAGPLIQSFREVRNRFLGTISRMDPSQSALHPRLNKQMRVVDLAYFVAEHDDHHLTIIHELLVSTAL